MDDGVAPKELTQFRILAKSSVGKGCVMLIQRILSSPAVWVFGEILAMPNVADLRGTEHEPSLRLLEIFAYGTYSDYIAQQAQLKLPALRPQDVSKLRMLSIVALAQKQPTISYSTLQRELDISNVRQLEDLIFETIYAGLIQAKLDQRAGVLKVSYAIARDVRLEDVDGLLQKLGAWSSAADEMLDALEVQELAGLRCPLPACCCQLMNALCCCRLAWLQPSRTCTERTNVRKQSRQRRTRCGRRARTQIWMSMHMRITTRRWGAPSAASGTRG
ncbi:unnamed protein product [Chrysoparadoxa australica]